MASLNDLVTDTRNAARPNSAKVSSTRAVGVTTIACDDLTGWPTASAVHFTTYQVDSNNDVVDGTQTDWKGLVSGNSIGSITLKDGTDSGNSVGDIVEMLPTSAWGQDLSDALMEEHNRDGTHAVITTDTISESTAGSGVTIDGLKLKDSKLATDNSVVTANITNAAVTTPKWTNPYKFHVYLAGAQNTSTGAFAKVVFDTEQFDSNNNFATGTYTVPVAGFYQFSSTVKIGTASTAIIALYKNGSVWKRGSEVAYTADRAGLTISVMDQFAANDTIEIWVFDDQASAITTGQSTCWFSGYLISET